MAALHPAMPNGGGGVAAGGRGRAWAIRGISLGRASGRGRVAVDGGSGGGERVVGARGRGRDMRGVIKVLDIYDECPICLLPLGGMTSMINDQ